MPFKPICVASIIYTADISNVSGHESWLILCINLMPQIYCMRFLVCSTCNWYWFGQQAVKYLWSTSFRYLNIFIRKWIFIVYLPFISACAQHQAGKWLRVLIKTSVRLKFEKFPIGNGRIKFLRGGVVFRRPSFQRAGLSLFIGGWLRIPQQETGPRYGRSYTGVHYPAD